MMLLCRITSVHFTTCCCYHTRETEMSQVSFFFCNISKLCKRSRMPEENQVSFFFCNISQILQQELNVGSDTVTMMRLQTSQGAQADPHPSSKALTMGMWAPELDHRAMEEGDLVWWVFFYMAGSVCIALRRTTYLSIVADHVLPFMAVASFSRIMHTATKHKWFRNGEFGEFEVLTLPPNFPDLNPNLWDVLDKQVRCMEVSPNLQDLKDLLLTSSPSGVE